MKIGILGMGKMGEVITQGLRRCEKTKSFKIEATTKSPENALEVQKRLSISCHNDNPKLVRSSEVILLCCKPHQAHGILKAVQSEFTKDQLLISICASISIEEVALWSGGKPAIIRAMPNTPCTIGEGMTVLAPGPSPSDTQEKHLQVAETIFQAMGKTAVIEESLMDGATGLSGCGPAFVYLMIESLSEAGVKVGLPRKVATLLAAQTLSGASKMVLERGIHPAALKDEVTTPAGCTIDGLMALEEGKFRATLIKAVLAASDRSKKLRETR